MNEMTVTDPLRREHDVVTDDSREDGLKITEVKTAFPPFYSSTPVVSRDYDDHVDEIADTTVSDLASPPPETTTTNIVNDKLPEQTAGLLLSPKSPSADKMSFYGPDDYPLTTSASNVNYSSEEITVPSLPSTSGSSYTPLKDEVEVTTTESVVQNRETMTTEEMTEPPTTETSMSDETPLSYAWIFPNQKRAQVNNLPIWTDSSKHDQTVAENDQHVKRKAPLTTAAPVLQVSRSNNVTSQTPLSTLQATSPSTTTTAPPTTTASTTVSSLPLTTTAAIIASTSTEQAKTHVSFEQQDSMPDTTKAQPSFDFLKSYTTSHAVVTQPPPPTTDDHWSLWESMLVCRNIKSPRVLAESLRNMKGYHFNFIVFDSVKLPQPFPFSLFDKFSFDFFEMLNISSLQFANNFSDKGRDYDYGRSYARNAGGSSSLPNARFTKRTTPGE